MPKINEQKTAELYKLQEVSIDKLLGESSQKNISAYKKNICTALEDPGHAKYRTMLKLLRSARAKKQKEETFVVNTMSALNSLEHQGVSSLTINKLITALFDKNLNYYKSSEKIKSFKQVIIDGDYWKNKQDVVKNIEMGTGGACEALVIHLIKLVQDQKLCEVIAEETGLPCSVKFSYGYSREYFKRGTAQHVFNILNIGDTRYILDPSFGEMSLEHKSGYTVKGSQCPSEHCNHNKNSIGNLIVDFKQQRTLTTPSGESTVPIGFLDGTDLFMSVGYSKYEAIKEELTVKEHAIPFIYLIGKEGEDDVHRLDENGKHVYTTNNTFTNYENNLVIEALISLYKAAGLKEPPALIIKS